MKKLLRLSSMLVTAVLLTFSAQESRASHWQGSDITYAAIGPNLFVATLKLYRDCTGATATSSASLNIKSTGCNPGRNVTMTQVGANRIGDPYCPTIPKTCNTSSVNYEEVVFKATITFSATEAQCADWIMSWSECCRPSIENLTNASSYSLYSEAYVKLFTTATPNNVIHNNSSPEFASTNVPIPFVCWNEDIVYSLNAAEFDGDSLSYELVQPLDGPTTPIAYSAFAPGGYITNQNPLPPYTTTPPNIQIAQLPGGGQYSATFPISSYTVNWNVINPATGYPYPIVQATPYFNLDPQSGQLTFKPSVYNANTPASQGRNKYAVVVKIKEWRQVNGTWVNIGYIRHDILFIVVDCTGNKPPTNPVPVPGPKTGAGFTDTLFTVLTCTTTKIELDYVDQNAIDKLTIDFGPNPVAQIPNGAFKLDSNGTSHPKATIWITPLPGDEGKRYFIPVRIEDDACPIKGITNKVYTIQVARRNRVNIMEDSVKTICIGQSLDLATSLERPDSIFQMPAQSADYRYKWRSQNGLNPADENNETVTVTPTRITGSNDSIPYIVDVTSRLNGCVDSDTIWVKVNPNPTIKEITLTHPTTKAKINELVFGRSGQLTTILDNPNVSGLKYSWSPGRGLSDSTIANPIATPLKTTEYTLTVMSADGICEGTAKFTVNVGPFFLPNVITPNNDGKNDVFEYKGILPNTSFKVFNRWGVLVKEYGNYDNSFNGDGVSDGTYYYIIQEPNGGKSYKGWFDIVRD